MTRISSLNKLEHELAVPTTRTVDCSCRDPSLLTSFSILHCKLSSKTWLLDRDHSGLCTVLTALGVKDVLYSADHETNSVSCHLAWKREGRVLKSVALPEVLALQWLTFMMG
jgi:hypothetical protein